METEQDTGERARGAIVSLHKIPSAGATGTSILCAPCMRVNLQEHAGEAGTP